MEEEPGYMIFFSILEIHRYWKIKSGNWILRNKEFRNKPQFDSTYAI